MGGVEGGRGRQRARQKSTSGGRGRPRRPPHGGGPIARPHRGPGRSARGGPRGEEGTTVEVGANGRRSGGEVEVVRPQRSRQRKECHTPHTAVFVFVLVVVRHRGEGRCRRGAVVRRRRPRCRPRRQLGCCQRGQQRGRGGSSDSHTGYNGR
jgi:hypothetical protein